MKKMLCMMLVLAALLGLCACGNTPQGNTTESCAHSWKDATCFFPKTCVLCAETEGTANGHSWDEGKCTVCGADDPDDDPLTDGTWFYISKQKWHVLKFYPDGTCDVRTVYGMPEAGATIEECAEKAITILKQQNRTNWEQLAKTKYHVFHILDYYYAAQMTMQSLEYRVENGLIIMEQEGTLPIYVKMETRGRLVSMGDEDYTYIKLPYTYISTLMKAYETNN